VEVDRMQKEFSKGSEEDRVSTMAYRDSLNQ
jgi:hypothetical protein